MILLGYAVAAAWCAPALLAPLTRRGSSPWLGLAAWLTAMGSVIAAIVLGAEHSVAAAAADWPQLTTALCRSVAGGVCTPQVYRSALYEAGVAAFAAVAMLLIAVALWRYGRRVQRGLTGSRSHARAALLVGRAIGSGAMSVPGSAPAAGACWTADAARTADAGNTAAGNTAAGDTATGITAAGVTGAGRRARTVVLDDPRPAAYCVAGHPAAIVVTSGALAALDSAQLAAVLAHERAHLAGRHHALLLLTRGLTAAFPGVPLFTAGAAEVARLAEMAADDTAARAHGRPVVIAALLALATAAAPSDASGRLPIPRHVPGHSLAAAAYAVPARVERLLCPARPVVSAALAVALMITLTVLAAAPPVLAAALVVR